jgi:ABC-type glycerol-3-phosphate transport system substrate-binding protein
MENREGGIMKTKTLMLGVASAGAMLLGLTAASADELHLYAWADEVPQDILDDFSKATGIDVTLDTFDSNESMVAKLDAGASGYDIIEPSQYAVQILIKKGLIQDLDHSKLSNLANLGEVFRNVSFDPGNKYSIPFICAHVLEITLGREVQGPRLHAGQHAGGLYCRPAGKRLQGELDRSRRDRQGHREPAPAEAPARRL